MKTSTAVLVGGGALLAGFLYYEHEKTKTAKANAPPARKDISANELAAYASWPIFDVTDNDHAHALEGFPKGYAPVYLLTNGDEPTEPGFVGSAISWASYQHTMGHEVFISPAPIVEGSDKAFFVLLDKAPPEFLRVAAPTISILLGKGAPAPAAPHFNAIKKEAARALPVRFR